MKKTALALILLMILLVSVLVGFVHFGVQASTDVSGISKPSVPEFTAEVVAATIEVTVKNQPLPSYENDSRPSLYYMFRFKDHIVRIGDWYYDPIYYVLPSTYGGYYEASDSDFTIISLSLEGYDFPSGQIDIQAIALVGYQYPPNIQNGTVYGFEGVTGEWSEIQTLTIPSSSSPSPTPPDSDTQQTGVEQVILALALIVIVIGAGLGLLVYLKKRQREKSP